MTASKQQEIFDSALEIADETERTAMVDRACGGDEQLRARIVELLAVHGRAEKFFCDCATAIAATADDFAAAPGPDGADAPASAETIDAAVGSRIGPYKLLQRIGEGGCGVVYMAEQDKPVRRRVALKIIKLGMDTKSVIARFEAERQALALMDHRNIARVLDAGATQIGRPFFVMELVHGIRITQYCDDNSLDTRVRLELFIQVCQAIQHAHQKGIIHRDIKPSNILVTLFDGVPAPKVIDFGIAKAIEEKLTEKTLFTTYGQVIGTPAYMSPEQAQISGMDVDTRSDIYSLGVLLYELLTGKTPFDQKELVEAGVDEMRRTLRDREPRRPSAKLDTLPNTELTVTAQRRHVEPLKLRSDLRGDLDWIVMRALEKDRNRRYQTANAIAADVQRYLDNEPVLARPPSRLYRFQKLVRRNKVVFAATGIVAMALVASSGVSTWLWLKEREARRRAVTAEEQRTIAEQQKATAEQQKIALQREAERLEGLRQAAEDNRKFAVAAALLSQGQRAKADAVLDEMPASKATAENAELYRTLGDWDATQEYWTKALNRFAVLEQVIPSDETDSTLIDMRYASLLVDQGEFAEYERFRSSLIERYAGTGNQIVAERVLRTCLLTDAGHQVTSPLGRLNELTVKSLESSPGPLSRDRAAWHCYSLALMAYRREDYSSATNWCARAFNYDRGVQCRDVGVQLVQAMACARLGRMEEARACLAAGREIIEENSIGRGKTTKWQGYWFDWVNARIHLREATSLIEGTDSAPD